MQRRGEHSEMAEEVFKDRNGHKPRKPKSAKELLGKELPAVKWSVPGILPEGVTLLAGRPKMGKSWLALGLCVAVTSGGYALGKVPVEQGAALYLGLEDNERRMQKRLRKVLAGAECPDGLDYDTEWEPLTEGGIEALRHWLEERPDARLIVIDILKRVRSRSQPGRNQYDVDYEALQPLKPLVEDYGVSILVVHHLRQMEAADPLEMISGSSGLTGVADGALILKRDRGKQDATLVIDGRDIEDTSELALKWDMDIASWSLLGDAEEYRMSTERAKIIDALRDTYPEPLSARDIADATGDDYDAIRQRLYQMAGSGLVKRVSRGLYTLPNNPNNPNNTNRANNPNNLHVVRPDTEPNNQPNNSQPSFTDTYGENAANVRNVREGDSPRASEPARARTREGFFNDPPEWFVKELELVRDGELTAQLVAKHAADQVLGDYKRWQEMLEDVHDAIGKE